jgi:putative addiction module component (TIGR02574 family)
MTKAAEEILHDALSLTIGERAELAVELIASLDGPDDESAETAWAAEIAGRVERVRQGQASGRPWAEVRADLERRSR